MNLQATETPTKTALRNFRMAERLRLLRKYYKLIYAAYRELGERKFAEMLTTTAGLNRNSTSAKELHRVASFIGRTPEELCQNTRNRDILEPRQVAMYLARHNTKETYAEIGENIGGKDRATVIHACNTVGGLLQTNPEYRKKWMPLIGAGER